MFMALFLPLMVLVMVPVGVGAVLFFRHRHGCDACTAQSYSCDRRVSGKSCPFFE